MNYLDEKIGAMRRNGGNEKLGLTIGKKIRPLYCGMCLKDQSCSGGLRLITFSSTDEFLQISISSSLFVSQLVDYRVEFSKWWVAEFKTIKFPSQGTVFDFYIDPETKKFEPWSKLIPQFEFDPEVPLQVCVPCVDWLCVW